MKEYIIVSTYRSINDLDLVICRHKNEDEAIRGITSKSEVIDGSEMPRIKTVMFDYSK